MKKRILALAAGLLLVSGGWSASAAFIVGEITFSGDFQPTGGTGLGNATGLDFLGDDFTVDDATGDFAADGISPGSIGFFQDFQFNPLTPSPVDPLWAIGSFQFTLEDLNIIFQSNAFLVVQGTGFLSGAGFDDTFGTWTLTGNSAGSLFNFSAGNTAAGVPVPGTLLLIGLGIVGLAASRKRFA